MIYEGNVYLIKILLIVYIIFICIEYILFLLSIFRVVILIYFC